MSPGLPRARAKNALLSGALLAFVAVSSRHVRRPRRPRTRRVVLSTEDECRAMQMAAKHATAGAGVGAEIGAGMGAAVPTPTPAPTPLEKEKETPPPRGVLPVLLERRAPWLLDPTRQTLLWGAPPIVRLSVTLLVVPSVPLAASWGALRALDAESKLGAWELDGLKVLWALIALYLLCLVRGLLWCPTALTRPHQNEASHVRLYRGRPRLHRLPHRARGVRRLACEEDETCAHPLAGPAQALHLLPLPPNVRAADVVYVPVHALERSAEVWVMPALKADAGLLDARVVHGEREWLRPLPRPGSHTPISLYLRLRLRPGDTRTVRLRMQYVLYNTC
ncbi:hypothetical protein FB451DRAFT_1378734 [Mycena latifolia]|nr:hypothetical protein FB451DRAFT_1378734 [Mycena latifolia]